MSQLPPALYHTAPFPLYGISFSSSPLHPHRIALSSFLSTHSNKIQIIDLARSPRSPNPNNPPNQTEDFEVLATANHNYPATKILFDPNPVANRGEEELVATTGDVLRIWGLGGGRDEGTGRAGEYVGRGVGAGLDGGMRLTERSKLSNSKSPVTNLPPSTSFSWNPVASNMIVTASVDTTATIWNIETGQALTQLICHDSPVNDISWLPSSTDVFVSAGHDSSLRAFDTRALEHSTILYESPSSLPLARLSFSPIAQHYLATFGLDDEGVIVLDMRSPGTPVATLKGHGKGVTGVGWGLGGRTGKGGGGWVATCGDDNQLLLYDLTSPLPYPPSSGPSLTPSAAASTTSLTPSTAKSPASRTGSPAPPRAPAIYPSLAYETGMCNDNLAWGQEIGGPGGEGWVGVVSGRRVTCLKV